jgi:hypothetical protein
VFLAAKLRKEPGIKDSQVVLFRQTERGIPITALD